MTPSHETISKLIKQYALTYGDATIEGYRNFAEQFIAAHVAEPEGCSIEIGTRAGGSARLFLELLECLYSGRPPFLFTVDPYGGKPYKGGDGVFPGLYNNDFFVTAKRQLADFQNHAHFYLEGRDFFEFASGMEAGYWFRGARKRFRGDTSFVLLDGDHDIVSISIETTYAMTLLRPKGIIFIDNIDKDPRIKPWLESGVFMQAEVEFHGSEWAVIRRTGS